MTGPGTSVQPPVGALDSCRTKPPALHCTATASLKLPTLNDGRNVKGTNRVAFSPNVTSGLPELRLWTSTAITLSPVSKLVVISGPDRETVSGQVASPAQGVAVANEELLITVGAAAMRTR